MIIRRERVQRALPGYVVGRQLGAGAFGLVLAGRHRKLRRPVAIKVLEAEGPEGATLDFVAEAQVLAGFDHPHVVRAFDYVEAEGLCLVVMELLPGGTLSRRWQGMSGEQACAVGLAVAVALEHTHARGVLHRDIKADNILFAADGTVKVSDFGIAKLFDGTAATASGRAGTPMYMAPEQIEGGRLGPATDLYALGVVLYRLLTGTAPFDPNQSVQTLWRQHLTEPPPPMVGVPPLVASVVRRALAKDPAHRHPDAAGFAVDLAEAATDSYGPGWTSRAGLPLHLDETVRRAADHPLDANASRRPQGSPAAGRAGVRRARRGLSLRSPWVVALLASVMVLAVVGAVVWPFGNAPSLGRVEISRRLAAESSRIAAEQPDLARRLAIAAYRTAPTSQARSSVLMLLTSTHQSLPIDLIGSNDLKFSPDGNLLATSGVDINNNSVVQLWDTTARGDDASPLVTFFAPGAVRSHLAFSPDGKLLAAGGSDNTFEVWDTGARGEVVQPLTSFVGSTDGLLKIVFSPDGNLLATGNTITAATSVAGIRIWDATVRGRVTQPLATLATPDAYMNFAFSPDGKVLATGGYENVQLWDVAGRSDVTRPSATFGESHNSVEIQFSPDGKLLASGGADGTTQVWDAGARGQSIAAIATFVSPALPAEGFGQAGFVQFSPNGGLLAVTNSGNTIQLWDTTVRGKFFRPISTLVGHTSFVTDIAFSPDGMLLVSGSEDGSSRIWDTAVRGTSAQSVATLVSLAGEVSGVAFSPDDLLLAVGGFGRGAWYWDINADRLVRNACVEPSNRLGEEEWKNVLADAPYHAPCP
ncbi:WD40 repeat domain-containing serine/threonine protein kinase [Parafrankia elaeagni]|uniref:WD40 repeat domain-containing serine/threonine protein kinase n=1 Tax=Parafrankia elaeagni TaxID=222534 RepID=UPI00035CF084|nr:serine/threonine-protein kinase [Parafrankia elaeagni]